MAATKITEAVKAQFLEHIRAGMRRGAAAEALKVSRTLMREYISEHPDFENRVLDAEIDANEHVEEALYQAAISGNVAAARVWLEMRGGRPQRAAYAPTGPTASPSPSEFGELDNVTVLDPRQRRKS